MFFLLPVLAVVAETAAAVTDGVIASAGTIGATVVAGATVGIGTATAATLETIVAGSTTTALNVGIAEAGKSLVKD